jgi:hypothetical protein
LRPKLLDYFRTVTALSLFVRKHADSFLQGCDKKSLSEGLHQKQHFKHWGDCAPPPEACQDPCLGVVLRKGELFSLDLRTTDAPSTAGRRLTPHTHRTGGLPGTAYFREEGQESALHFTQATVMTTKGRKPPLILRQ